MKKMNFAIIGAGSVGQIVAGRLSASGHKVVMVARSNQLENLQNIGVWLALKGEMEQRIAVAVVDSLPVSTMYDAVFLAIRGDQLEFALNTIRASGVKGRALVLCMPVWGPNPSYIVDGFDDTWLMFPGFGAKVGETGSVDYFFSRRPSEIGPMEGQISPVLQNVVDALSDAGIPTKAKADFGYRYTSLSVIGGPFGVAIAQSGFDMRNLSRNRKLCRTAALAAKECIVLIEARTGRSLGFVPRFLTSILSPMLSIFGTLMARGNTIKFVLSHRRKVEKQDLALLMELYQWGIDNNKSIFALSKLLSLK